MKKKAVRLIIVFALLAVLIAVLFIVMKLTKKEKTPQKEPESVSQTEVADIEGLTYRCESSGGEEVSLVRENGIWYYEKDRDFPLDQEYVTNTMVKTAAQAAANKTIENPSDDLASYGLDNPVLTITLKKITGDTVTMNIGSYNESVEGYYLKVDGDSNIYLVNGELVFGFDMTIYELADKEDFPLVETTSFTHIKIERPDSVIEFKGEIEEDAETYISQKDYVEKVKTWKMSDNGSVYRTCSQDKVQELIQLMSGYDYESMAVYHATAEERSSDKYGFGASKTVLTVDYEVLDETTARQVQGEGGINEIVCDTIQKQYVLEIGAKVPENGYDDPAYYVSLADSDVIYTMTADMLDSIVNMDAKDYR